MKALCLLLLVCGFAVGLLLGIWLDWRVPRHKDLTYVMTDYQLANLSVSAGDRLSLVDRAGSRRGNLLMNFVGNTPCEKNQNGLDNHVNSCVLKSSLGTGSYYFTCGTTPNGPDLCDPGIQPPPTTPIEGPNYWPTVLVDLDLSAAQPPPTAPGEPGTGGTGTPSAASSLIRAIVSCNSPNPPPTPPLPTTMDVLGQSGTTINATQGQTIFWTSSDPFTLTSTPPGTNPPVTFPSGYCSNSDINPSPTEYKCTVAGSGVSLSYYLQQTPCSPLNAAVNPPVRPPMGGKKK